MIDKDKIIESFDENYEAGKGILHGFRRFINDLMLKGKNIDRLMTDKVEDYVLVQELPIGFKVGKRTVYVGNFPFKNEHKFFKKWAMIISNLNSQILNWELSEERRKELLDQASFHLLGNGKYMLEFLLMNKWLGKKLIRLIGSTILKQQQYYRDQLTGSIEKIEWKNCSYGYFKKHISKELLIEICFMVFFYNFDAVKKNLWVLTQKMDLQQDMETYMYFWLENLAGLTGKFQLARAIKFNSSSDDQQKIKLDIKGQQMDKEKNNERNEKKIIEKENSV